MTTNTSSTLINKSRRHLNPVGEGDDDDGTESTCEESESQCCYDEEDHQPLFNVPQLCEDDEIEYEDLAAEDDDDEGQEEYMYYDDDCTYEEHTVDDDVTFGGDNNDMYTYVTVPEGGVKFNPTLTIHLIPTRYEYSEKERKRVWTTTEDKQKTERRLSRTLNRMLAREQAATASLSQSSSSSSSSRHNHDTRKYRGLENFSQEGERAVSVLISTMVNTVMDEQDRQWMEGVANVEEGVTMIANISQSISSNNILHAQSVAKQDEEDAINVYVRSGDTSFFLEEYVVDEHCGDSTTSSTLYHRVQQRIRKKLLLREKKHLQKHKRQSSRRLLSKKVKRDDPRPTLNIRSRAA